MDYKELIKTIKKHNKLYNEGKPIISDEEFDLLFKQLEDFEIDNPNISIGFANKIREEKIKFQKESHLMPMLSVRNTYDIEELKKILLDFPKPIIMEPKIDGVACSVRDGKLITRGNGLIGEDITRHWNNIENLPIYPYEVRGEIFSRTLTRNMVVGSLNRKICKNQLEFLPYEIIEKGSRFENMKKLSIKTIPQLLLNEIPEEGLINNFMDKIKSDKIPIDGVVFKVDNIEKSIEMGATARYPKFLIAYKISTQKKVVIVKDIKWNITRQGRLVPICLFDSFFLGPTKITKVFGHNYKFLLEKGIGINSMVEVAKVGEVIPYIKEVLSQGSFNKPLCECGSNISDDYFCLNQSCPEKIIQKVLFFLKSINTPTIGVKTIKKLNLSDEIEILKHFSKLSEKNPDDNLIIKIFGQEKLELIKNIFIKK